MDKSKQIETDRDRPRPSETDRGSSRHIETDEDRLSQTETDRDASRQRSNDGCGSRPLYIVQALVQRCGQLDMGGHMGSLGSVR